MAAHNPPDKQKEYQRRYFEKHQAELAARRRKKYRADPKYRRRILLQSSAYRDARGEPVKRTMLPGELRTIKGVRVELLTVRQFAGRLARSPRTLDALIKQRLIPPPPLRRQSGDRARLYTAPQAELVWLLLRHHHGRRTWPTPKVKPQFFEELRAKWQALPLHATRAEARRLADRRLAAPTITQETPANGKSSSQNAAAPKRVNLVQTRGAPLVKTSPAVRRN